MENFVKLGPKKERLSGVDQVDAVVKEMKRMPFFMTELDEEIEKDNPSIDALKALVYEGDPDEIAINFKNQGNSLFKEKKYKDAIIRYTKALEAKSGVDEIDIACYTNRAACNLELRNYRRCINDCKLALAKDSSNMKAIYRSARAYLAVDRIDEAIDIAQYGLSIEPGNITITSVMENAKARKSILQHMEQEKEAKQRLKDAKANYLKMALQSKNFTAINTGNKPVESFQSLQVKLEDELDPSSSLIFPVMLLYPVELESDLFSQVSESSLVSELLEQVFASSPAWFSKNRDHATNYVVTNLEVYAQTITGGLVKIGKSSTMTKILSLKKPIIPIIDSVVRFYVVPKNKAQDWLSSWNKDQAFRQMGNS